MPSEDKHNWANSAPCSTEYKEEKADRLPIELELEANETFQMLELARLRVNFYEVKLADIQSKINTLILKRGVEIEDIKPVTRPKKKVKPKETKKDKEIKMAVHEKEVIQETEKTIEKALETRKNLWD